MFDKNKYVVEEHKVETEDGYILTVFRVNLTDIEKEKLSEKLKKNIGKVIVLQHGLLDSSEGMFYNGELGVGFHLLNQGYDIWAPNNRGNKYSLSHTDPNLSYKDFWDFCWDEMAIFDVPANYNYILSHTSQPTLIWIGHSEGTSQFFAAASDSMTASLITKKTSKFIALAPIVFMKHCGSPVLDLLAIFRNIFFSGFEFFSVFNLLPSFCQEKPNWAKLGQFFCDKFTYICDNIVPGVHFEPKIDNILDNIQRLITHYPSGTSYKNIMKYAQVIKVRDENNFQMFDYGAKENMKKYGTSYPRKWDVSRINVDTVLIGGTKDMLGNREDVSYLSSVMKVDKVRTYWLEDFEHVSFLMARDPRRMFEIIDKELEGV